MADPEVFYDLCKTNAERTVRNDAIQTQCRGHDDDHVGLSEINCLKNNIVKGWFQRTAPVIYSET